MNKKDYLLLDLPNVSICLSQNFPIDPKSDIQLIYKNRHFKLQKKILKQFSKYFERVLLSQDIKIYEIKLNIDEQIFDNVISTIYGNAINIDRSQKILPYYSLAKYLQIEQMLQIIVKDILDNFEQYDTFMVMKFAHENNIDELFKKCIDELELQFFQQMKYYQLSLFNIDLSLFKLIIKSHNNFRNRTNKGLPYKQINDIIKSYCDANNMSIYRNQQIKLELIQISLLTALEFKEIFMDIMVQKIQKLDNGRNKINQQSDRLFKKRIAILLEIQQIGQVNKNKNQNFLREIKYYVENIYLKKLLCEKQKANNTNSNTNVSVASMPKISDNKQIKKQNSKYTKVLQEPASPTSNNKKQKNQKNKLNEFLSVIDKMSQQYQQKIQEINQIVSIYQQKQKNKVNKINQQQLDSTQLAGAQFLSSRALHKMMTNNKIRTPAPKHPKINNTQNIQHNFLKNSLKNSVKNSQKNLQKLQQNLSKSKKILNAINKDSRLSFDYMPISIQSNLLPVLSQMIRQDGFKKKNLHLLYRRSNKHNAIGQNNCIFNKEKSLLILFKTKKQIQIGCYITSNIPQKQNQIQDKQAFIFNMYRKLKFKIDPQFSKRALIISDQYLISFANDLTISKQFLTVKSKYFELHYNLQNNKEENLYYDELGLEQQFEIQHLQIYQVQEGQMEMLL